MSLIVDPHVHLYPCYDLKAALNAAISNLSRLAGNSSSQLAIILTERTDCTFFAQLGSLGLPLEQFPEGVWRYGTSDNARLLIYPGRQVISAERIEVLALLTDHRWPDRELPCADLLDQIRAARGLPVINWAPGKWWGKRGGMIATLLQDQSNRPLLVCDTTLRPCCWPQPALMRRAMEQGVVRVAGSDPLPFAGEEHLIGSYATQLPVQINLNRPLSSLREALAMNQGAAVGNRSGPLQFLTRMARLKYTARHSRQACISSSPI